MEIKNKSLMDFQKEWEMLVNKALTNYNSLSKNERLWFNVESLISSVDDGGLISHYYNSGANYNAETIEDLNYLGFNDISKLLEKINEYFPNGKPPHNMEERNKVIENWTDRKFDKILKELDNNFFEKEKKLEQSLIKFIEDEIIKSRI